VRYFSDLYTLFIKADANSTATIDFVKSTLKITGTFSWADTDDGLLSTMIDASTIELATLVKHENIVRAVQFMPKEQGVPPKARYLVSSVDATDRQQFDATTASLNALIKGQFAEGRTMWEAYLSEDEALQIQSIDDVSGVSCILWVYPNRKGKPLTTRYAVVPTDPDNQEQYKATEAALKVLLNKQFRDEECSIQRWEVTSLTDEQKLEIEKMDGVSRVGKIHMGRRDVMARPRFY
jgi:WD40 repeat protein